MRPVRENGMLRSVGHGAVLWQRGRQILVHGLTNFACRSSFYFGDDRNGDINEQCRMSGRRLDVIGGGPYGERGDDQRY